MIKKKTEEGIEAAEDSLVDVQEENADSVSSVENDNQGETASTDSSENEKITSEKKPKKKSAKNKKSGKQKPSWVNYEKEEVEKLIIKLGHEGRTKSQIGLLMRDQYGIPDTKAFGMSVGRVLKKANADREMPEDLYNLMKKAVTMFNHLEKSKKDKKGVHTLQLIESRVRKLGRYYSSVGKLPKDWKYDINKAKLIVKG
jgi:small subunit ribosomal protein S15